MSNNKFKLEPSFFDEISIGLVILWILSSFILTGFILSIQINQSTFGLHFNNDIYELLTTISFYIIPLLGFIYMLKKSKYSRSDFKLSVLKDINYKEFFIDIVFIYIFAISTFIVFIFIIQDTNIKIFKGCINNASSIASNYSSRTNSVSNIINNLLSIVFAPIIEEFIFRGVLLHSLNLRFGIKKSIVILSILFGIIHVTVLGSFVFSFVMCIIYIRTKSIIIPIVYHASNNLLVTLLSLIPTTNFSDKTYFNISICGVFISVIWLIYFIKRERSYYLK